jgi:hypothetical protein
MNLDEYWSPMVTSEERGDAIHSVEGRTVVPIVTGMRMLRRSWRFLAKLLPLREASGILFVA